jgi:hypothetical protein
MIIISSPSVTLGLLEFFRSIRLAANSLLHKAEFGFCDHSRRNGYSGTKEQAMKVTVNIDCTPLEAREFMGLPNVAPMQENVMKQLETQMMDNITKMTPEAMLKNWMSFAPDQFQDLFKMTFGGSKSK